MKLWAFTRPRSPLGNRSAHFCNVEYGLGCRAKTKNIAKKLILLLEQLSPPVINKDGAELRAAQAAPFHAFFAMEALMGEHQIQIPVAVQINFIDTLVMKAPSAACAAHFDLLVHKIASCLAMGSREGFMTDDCDQPCHHANDKSVCRFVCSASMLVHLFPKGLRSKRSSLFRSQCSATGNIVQCIDDMRGQRIMNAVLGIL